MELQKRLQALSLRTEPLERFLQAFAASLPEPLHYHSGQKHYGFRFGKPDVRHFCLLKAIRAVSAFNASIALARGGYTQEIAVLMRTLIECTTHIEFVLTGLDSTGKMAPAAESYVQAYFDDYARNNSADFKRPQVRQNKVHEAVGNRLDEFAQQYATKFTNMKAAKRFSNIYLTFSNYVHARYPEVMDLYGGIPGQFHLRGMKGTPKDKENIETLETFFVTVSQSLMQIVLSLKLRELVLRDPLLAEWFRTL